MKLNRLLLLAALASSLLPLHAQRAPEEIRPPTKYDFSKLKMEKLGRGVIAVRQNADEVFVTWRYLTKDPLNTAFNVYRDGKKLNSEPVADVTYFIDKNKGGGAYEVKPVVDGKEADEWSAAYRLPENAPAGYVNIPLAPSGVWH